MRLKCKAVDFSKGVLFINSSFLACLLKKTNLFSLMFYLISCLDKYLPALMAVLISYVYRHYSHFRLGSTILYID